VKLERLDLLEELLDIRAEHKALQKAYENGYRGIGKVREEHGKARKKVTKLRKDSDKLIKSHAKELKKVEARADARAQTEYKHVLQEKAALEQAVALLLAQIKSLLAEKVAEGDGAVESLEGVVVKMRSSTKGRPVLGRWRDLIAKLHDRPGEVPACVGGRHRGRRCHRGRRPVQERLPDLCVHARGG
jgi:hypothetical protein